MAPPKSEVCQVFCYDQKKIDRLKPLVEGENTWDITQIFKALSSETRFKVAYALALETELCVCDLAQITESSIASASHHLRFLKKIGLANNRQEGKLVFYSLTNEPLRQLILKARELTGPTQLEESTPK